MTAGAYPPVGSRVRLAHDVERFPHFVAPAGALGTVVYLDADLLRVRFYDVIDGADTWDNEIVWSLRDDDVPGDALELVDYVNRDALDELDTDGLRAVIDAGGPSELIDAARDLLAVRLDAEQAHGAARQIAGYVGERRRTDEAYEVASADVVLALTLADAHAIADGLELLADLDEGEHVDDETLRRLAALVRSRIPLDRDAALAAVLAAMPADGTPLAFVEAADRALDALPGYIGSVPEGRAFVADVLLDTGADPDDRPALAAWLVDELTAE